MAIYKGSNFIGLNSIKEKRIYVEVPEGSTIDEMSENNTIAIQPEEYAALQDAVGYRTGKYSQNNIQQMISDMKKKYFQNRQRDIFYDYHITTWTRPQNWPDLDSLNLQMSGNDFIYMTYDNTHGRAAIALHIEKINNGTNITVTMGHINNGTYIIDETIVGNNNNYLRWLTSNDENYPVIRVTGDIKLCYTYNVTNNGITQHFRRQPILERIAYVPHLTTLVGNSSYNAWGVFTLQREKINNGDGAALTNIAYAWAYSRDLEELDISGLKTQKVTTMDSAFRQLLKLRELNLSHLDVSSNKTFSNMFYDNRAMHSINLNTWDTSSGTAFNGMFYNCYALSTLSNIENFNTSKATTLSGLFYHCRELEELNLTSWDTSNVTNLSSCFAGCYSLIELDLSHWQVNKVTNCSSIFTECYSLKRINFTGWRTGTITTIYNLFANCWSLQYINLDWLQITSACNDICYVFSNCYSLKEINLPTWDVTGVIGTGNRSHSVFSNCWSVEHITGITNWNFQHTNSSATMFSNCYNLQELDVSGWNITGSTNLSSCFANCQCLKYLNLSNWNPANCTNLSSMFSGCSSLLTVGDISDWDTSKCTTLASMFRYCTSLKEIPDMSDWDLSQVTSIGSIFSECTSLEKVIWTNVDLPVCTNIEQLFRYDYNLKYVNLSNWSIPQVANSTSYYHTLGDCWALQDVISFPIPSTYTNIGFQNCENLSYNSLMTIINALPQVTGTHILRIPSISLNLLTTEEKAIATNKNWTLANS